MAWVSEASNSVIDAYECTVVVPAGGYSAGHLLVLGVGTSNQPLTVTAADTKGNVWAHNQVAHEQDPTILNKGSVNQLSCRIASPLVAGDIVTITTTSLPEPPARLVCVIEQFDDDISYVDVGSGHSSEGVQKKDITSGVTQPTASPNQLVVGAIILDNPGRTLTPGAGFTAGTKIISTAGLGDRAVVMQWQYVTEQGPQESYASVETNTYWAATVQTYALSGDGEVRSGLARVWTGTAWEQYPAKVWTGTGWQAHAMKAWDGVDWRRAK